MSHAVPYSVEHIMCMCDVWRNAGQTLAVLPIGGDLKAGVADTVEAAVSVHTAPVVTDTTVSDAFIQI